MVLPNFSIGNIFWNRPHTRSTNRVSKGEWYMPQMSQDSGFIKAHGKGMARTPMLVRIASSSMVIFGFVVSKNFNWSWL